MTSTKMQAFLDKLEAEKKKKEQELQDLKDDVAIAQASTHLARATRKIRQRGISGLSTSAQLSLEKKARGLLTKAGQKAGSHHVKQRAKKAAKSFLKSLGEPIGKKK